MGYVRKKYTKEYILRQTEEGAASNAVEVVADYETSAISSIDIKILECVDFRNARILEFGFGTGDAAKYMIDRGAAYYEVINFSDATVENAAGQKTRFELAQPPLGPADALQFLRSYVPRHKADNLAPFSIVFMLDFVEHLPREQLREFLALLKEIVAPHALFVIDATAYPVDSVEDAATEAKPAAPAVPAANAVPLATIDKTKGTHCNRYTLVSHQRFMKECGFSGVSQSHFFILDAESRDEVSSFRSYRQRWEAAVKAGVPLHDEWKQDVIEYAYLLPDSLRWQQFPQGDLKGCRFFMTDSYFQLMANGNYDTDMFEDLNGQTIEGKTVFDVGGFMGITALLFAKRVGPNGRVCVFEPNPWNQDRMALNFSENPESAAAITGYCDALSNADGTAEIIFSKNVDNGYSSTTRLSDSHIMLSNQTVFGLGFQKVQTATLRLDTFVQKTGIIPDVIKVDIEGAENQFLQGAEQTIKSYLPLLYIELHSPYCTIWCTRLLEQYGYRMVILREEEDGRLFIKAQPIVDFSENAARDTSGIHGALRSVVVMQNDLRRELKQLEETEQRHHGLSLKLQSEMAEAMDALKSLKEPRSETEEKLGTFLATLQRIEEKQNAFEEGIKAKQQNFKEKNEAKQNTLEEGIKAKQKAFEERVEADRNAFKEGVEIEWKAFRDSIEARQMAFVESLEARQNALFNQIHVAVSFKGMLRRAAKLPPRLFRKIGRVGLRLLKPASAVAIALPRKCKSLAVQIANRLKTAGPKPVSAEELIFDGIFRENAWGSEESHSGTGSTLSETQVIRVELPRIVKKYGIKTFLDLPCGDFNWMRHVDLGVKRYIGGDIVKDLVAANSQKYGGAGREFKQLNLLTSRLPRVHLIFCRDCLVHLSFEDVQRALDNLHRSGIKYLLATTFTGRSENSVIPTGHWTPYNLLAAPFRFPQPIEMINENCMTFYPDYSDKSLGLWKIEDLPRTLLLANDRKVA